MSDIMASLRISVTSISLALLLTACASDPVSPENSAAVRSKLTALQSDPELASRARMEIREAEIAVEVAEKPLAESAVALGAHRVYMADQKVEIARARAATRLAEDQRMRLSEERGDARLDARTREADKAHADATAARSSEADMQKRLDDLKARETERGIVVTLGDVLFDSGSAQLRENAGDSMNKLVSFLTQYPDRRVLIEGHTDNVGSHTFNQELSRRRADSVRQRLEKSGIALGRMSVSGMGLQRPVATNGTASGRQQNRRVEIIIENSANDVSGGGIDTSSQR